MADFGIAQVTFEDRLTRTGAALGTLGFIAPEQLDSAKHVDGRADIYSIGATLYMLLDGRSPRDLFMYNEGDPLFANVPESLEEIIIRCTRHKREDRIDNLTELLAALEIAKVELEPLDPGFPLLAPPQAPPIPHGLRSAAITPSRIGSGGHRLTRPPTFHVEGPVRTVKPKAKD